MKRFISALLCAQAVCTLWGAHITESQARAIAARQLGTALDAPALRSVKAPGTSASDVRELYIFNASEGGFAIISADDEMPGMVLAYSPTGAIDPADCSPALRSWLRDMQSLIARGSFSGVPSPRATGTTAGPLLTTKWNQSSPYNNLTPTDDAGDHMPTGCVATALAQVMNYWQYPTEGGLREHSYQWGEETFTVDFTQSRYDWANMADTYSPTSTQAQNDAVAKLMWDCGVATNMQYATGGSGSSDYDCVLALTDIFGYDSTIRLRTAAYLPADEWEQIVRTELDAERPVLMFGATVSKEGHAFVCDGYDADGLFHINWGWGGAADGYFNLTALDPEQQGIGGASSGEGFSEKRSIITGVQRPVTGSEAAPGWEIVADALQIIPDEDGTTFSLGFVSIYNLGFRPFAGTVTLLLSEEGSEEEPEEVDFGTFAESSPLEPRSGYPYALGGLECGELGDGTYTFRLVATDVQGHSQPVDYIQGYAPLTFTIENGRITTVTQPVLTVSDITFTSLDNCSMLLVPSTFERLSLTLTNSAPYAFSNMVRITLKYAGPWGSTQQYSTYVNLEAPLLGGQSATISADLPFSTQGDVEIALSESANEGSEQYPVFIDSEFIHTPSTYYELRLAEPLPTVTQTADGLVITANVVSSLGGTTMQPVYDVETMKELTCSIIPVSTDDDAAAAAAVTATATYEGAWSHERQLQFTFPGAFAPADYLATFTYLSENGMSGKLTLTLGAEDEYPGLNFTVGASGINDLRPDEDAAAARYFNMQGAPVSAGSLTPGTYVRVTPQGAAKVLIK